jgi:hypothetical protein
MSDIFISYSREDVSIAENLAKEFESKGWSIFWDHTIPPGKTWRNVIGSALKKAKCVIVLWSESSIDSDWVITEAEFGKKHAILIPAFIKEVEPPLGFGSIQGANLKGWVRGKEHHGMKVLEAVLKGLLDTKLKDVNLYGEEKFNKKKVEKEPAIKDIQKKDEIVNKSTISSKNQVKSKIDNNKTFDTQIEIDQKIINLKKSQSKKVIRKRIIIFGLILGLLSISLVVINITIRSNVKLSNTVVSPQIPTNNRKPIVQNNLPTNFDIKNDPVHIKNLNDLDNRANYFHTEMKKRAKDLNALYDLRNDYYENYMPKFMIVRSEVEENNNLSSEQKELIKNLADKNDENLKVLRIFIERLGGNWTR